MDTGKRRSDLYSTPRLKVLEVKILKESHSHLKIESPRKGFFGGKDSALMEIDRSRINQIHSARTSIFQKWKENTLLLPDPGRGEKPDRRGDCVTAAASKNRRHRVPTAYLATDSGGPGTSLLPESSRNFRFLPGPSRVP